MWRELQKDRIIDQHHFEYTKIYQSLMFEKTFKSGEDWNFQELKTKPTWSKFYSELLLLPLEYKK